MNQGVPGSSSQAAASTKYKDKTYAVPQVTDAPALLYNKAMFRSAGVTVPTTMPQNRASPTPGQMAPCARRRMTAGTHTSAAPTPRRPRAKPGAQL